MFCAVLCTAVVHNHKHTREQFLQAGMWSQGCGLLDCTLYYAVSAGIQFLPVVPPQACPVIMPHCCRTYSWSSSERELRWVSPSRSWSLILGPESESKFRFFRARVGVGFQSPKFSNPRVGSPIKNKDSASLRTSELWSLI